MINKKGLCMCGCGQKTSIAKQNNTRYGWIKGQPVKYIYNHHSHERIGPNHPGWKGGKKLSSTGYIVIWKPEHPRADPKGYIKEHILVAEEVLGKPLPNEAVVHHINENKADNQKENLVICQDQNYHKFLHVRLRALKACGNPNWRKCSFCKKYDDPNNLYLNGTTHYHHQKNKKCFKDMS